MRVFFTYVWGEPTSPAWPLTFADKASRKFAKDNVSDGDYVFTVATKGEPTRDDLRGKVTGLYRLTSLELNTAEYDLPRDARPEHDTIKRFPYAIHPLEVWNLTGADNYFSALVGPLTPKHHLQAQSRLVELDDHHAEILLALPKTAIDTILMPSSELGKGLLAKKKSKLAPSHSGAFAGEFRDHDVWYVYSLALRDLRGKTLAQKIGYSHAPEARLSSYNAGLASEVTGLQWHLESKQPTGSEEAARVLEQSLFQQFAHRKLDSNGEIIRGGYTNEITVAIGTLMRSKSTDLGAGAKAPTGGADSPTG